MATSEPDARRHDLALPANAAGRDEAPVGWQLPVLELLAALTRHPYLITGALVIGAVVAALQIVRAEPYYRSSAVAILMQRNKPVFDASIETGSLETSEGMARSGSGASFTLPPNSTLYVTLIKSRPILEKLALEYQQQLVRDGGLPANHRSDEFVSDIRRMITVTGNDEGLMTVTVTSADPELSANLANALIDEAEEASGKIERQLLLQQSTVLSRSAEAARAQLEAAEQEYRSFCARHALIDPELQAAETLEELRLLRQGVHDLRAELTAQLLSFTESSGEVRRLREKIAEGDAQLARLQESVLRDVGAADFGGLLLSYQTLGQRVSFRRDLLMTLSTQAEIYRIRAEQASGSLALIRAAAVNPLPAGPSKKKIVAVALGLALLLSVGLSILIEQARVIGRHRVLQGRLEEVQGNLAEVVVLRSLPVIRSWRRSA